MFTVSTTRFLHYVELVVAGPASIKHFVDMVQSVARDTEYWSDRRALVDLRNVVGELTAPEQVFLGELVAQDLCHLERIASVVPADRITRNSETAAQELGMRLRVFASKEEAVAWLMSGADADAARSPAQSAA